MDIRQRDKIMRDGNIIGHTRVVKVVKNKLAPLLKKLHLI
jgi:RecA/RadA recombinase